jgi:NADPH2:quinone reductase
VRAVQFDEFGGPEVLHLADIARPEPAPGEIRIRVAAIGVNPADFKWRQGMFQHFAPVSLPHVLGYDVAGVIDALGSEVGGLELGQPVFAMLNNLTKGGYAEYAIVPAADAAPVPEGLDAATAATLPTAGLTGLQMIEEHIRPKPGQSVLVTGATGAVGRFAVHAALQIGARVVAAVRAQHAEEALALGTHAVIALDATAGSDDAEIAFDHVADTVGGPEVARLCRRVDPAGMICTVSTTPIDPQGLPSAPVFIAVHADRAQLIRLARAVAAGEIGVPIARRMPLAQAAEAHRLIEAGGVGGKIILVP